MDLTAFDVPFEFRKRPSPIHPHLRPVWRMASIALIVQLVGRNQRLSLRRLRVADWLMLDPAMVQVIAHAAVTPTIRVVRFDPPLERAILLGAAEKLWKLNNAGHMLLLEPGVELAHALVADTSVFVQEKLALNSVRRLLTEDFVKSLLFSENV